MKCIAAIVLDKVLDHTGCDIEEDGIRIRIATGDKNFQEEEWPLLSIGTFKFEFDGQMALLYVPMEHWGVCKTRLLAGTLCDTCLLLGTF